MGGRAAMMCQGFQVIAKTWTKGACQPAPETGSDSFNSSMVRSKRLGKPATEMPAFSATIPCREASAKKLVTPSRTAFEPTNQ